MEKRCGKAVAEVIRTKDSDAHSAECVQHKHIEKWELIGIEARHIFERCTLSMIKCIAGINHYGK